MENQIVLEKVRAQVAAGEVELVTYGEKFYWRTYMGGCWWCGKQWHTTSRMYSGAVELCETCGKGGAA